MKKNEAFGWPPIICRKEFAHVICDEIKEAEKNNNENKIKQPERRKRYWKI